jgi:hypothetical protein
MSDKILKEGLKFSSKITDVFSSVRRWSGREEWDNNAREMDDEGVM